MLLVSHRLGDLKRMADRVVIVAMAGWWPIWRLHR